MGDRANVVVVDGVWGSEVFLYTHWEGSELPMLVQTVLAKKTRWDDAAYLARMVFSAMVKTDIDGSTGFGISSKLGDNSYPLIVLDTVKQQVRFERENDRSTIVAYSFNDYVNLPKPRYPKEE